MYVLLAAYALSGLPAERWRRDLGREVCLPFSVLPAKACARHGSGDLLVIAIDALVS